MIFSYQAKDGTGRTVTGSLEAQSERHAASEIRALGYFPLRLAPQPATAGAGDSSYSAAGNYASAPVSGRSTSVGRWLLVHFVFPIVSGVGLRDLALLFRQFAAMIHSGVPIYQCLTTLVQQSNSPALRGCLRKISVQVQAGGTLTEAMAEFPWIFTEFHRAMIAAGEQTGQLDLMFNRLSDALEQEYGIRNVIKRETWYPVLTLVSSFLIPPIVDVVVRNDWNAYYQDAIKPLQISCEVILAIFVLTKLGAQFKTFYDTIIAHLPGIGGAVRMVSLARFARALASLYAAGVIIPEAIRYAAAATGNEFMKNRLLTAIPGLQGGGGMVQALGKTRVLPPLVMSMLGTGEQTGSLDQTMDKVAEYYEMEAATRMHQLSVSLGAFALIIAGVQVAIILGKFYGGYANDLMKQMDSN